MGRQGSLPAVAILVLLAGLAIAAALYMLPK